MSCPYRMDSSQLKVLARLAVKATYNYAHVRKGATEEEIKNLKDKAEVLNLALKICKSETDSDGKEGSECLQKDS